MGEKSSKSGKWDFEEDLPRRKTRHDRMKTKDEKPATKKRPAKPKKEVNQRPKDHIEPGTKLHMKKNTIILSDEQEFEAHYGVCPSKICSHTTVSCLSEAGARSTLLHHVKEKHR